MSLEDLYREVILDHYRNPRNKGHLDAPDARAEGVNPLCGDELTIELAFEGDQVSEVAIDGQGCSISQSSASMMSDAIKGIVRNVDLQRLTKNKSHRPLGGVGCDLNATSTRQCHAG